VATATTSTENGETFSTNGVGCFGSNEDGYYMFSSSYLWKKSHFVSKDRCGASRPAIFIGIITCIIIILLFFWAYKFLYRFGTVVICIRFLIITTKNKMVIPDIVRSPYFIALAIPICVFTVYNLAALIFL
jgi:hypothetical protein